MKLWRFGYEIEQLGQRYHLEGALGSGGMADVYLAWDVEDECEVAIKVMKQDQLEQQRLDRFVKEAAQVALWRHPNILRIYGGLQLELLDAAQGSIVPYMVMEYAQGGDLYKRMSPGVPMALPEILYIFAQLCSAVAYAHERGVIHRDLKPLNILFRRLPDDSEQVVLSDFGLAVEVDATHHSFAHGGTLPYMAPEQLQGQAQPASDIFALGVILYQLCTGRLPFRRSLHDLRAGEHPLPVPPSTLLPTLPVELDEVIFTALAQVPTQRYATATEMWEAVRGVIGDSTLPRPARRRPAPGMTPDRMGAKPTARLTKDEHTGTWSTVRLKREQTDVHATEWMLNNQTGINEQTGMPDRISLRTNQLSPSMYRTGDSRGRVFPTRSDPDPITPPRLLTALLTTSRQSAARHRRRNLRIANPSLLALLCIVLVMLACLFWAVLPTVSGLLGWSNSGDVTITPTSKVVADSYILHAVVGGQTNAAQREVAVRTLTTAQPATQNGSVNATGHNQSAGTRAQGALTFTNGEFTPVTIDAGTQIRASNGVTVSTDVPLTIPAATPGGNLGSAMVNAHATSAGASGNILIKSINRICCTTDNFIFVRNDAAFSGGQDAKDYAFVQQSDVDAFVSKVKGPLVTRGQADVRGQVKAGEALAGDAQCPVTTNTNGAVDDHGQNVPALTVSVAASCQALAYDQNSVRRVVTTLLQDKAKTSVSAAYALHGNITTSVQLQPQTPGQGNNAATATLLVNARGLWTYQISASQKQHMARLIAGKSALQARTILWHQPGVSSVTLSDGGGNNGSLPDDVGKVHIQSP